MIFWVCITLLAVIIGIAFFCAGSENTWRADWAWPCAFIMWGLAVCISVAMIVVPLDYQRFETEFEIKREMYNEIASNSDIDVNKLMLMTDILDANKELANFQTKNIMYGFASFIPDRVHDIKPLGT